MIDNLLNISSPSVYLLDLIRSLYIAGGSNKHRAVSVGESLEHFDIKEIKAENEAYFKSSTYVEYLFFKKVYLFQINLQPGPFLWHNFQE